MGGVAEQDMAPADRVERPRLAAAVAGGPVEGEGLLGVIECPVGPVPPPPQVAELLVGVCLAGQVSGLWSSER